jgi:hypothetical protein
VIEIRIRSAAARAPRDDQAVWRGHLFVQRGRAGERPPLEAVREIVRDAREEPLLLRGRVLGEHRHHVTRPGAAEPEVGALLPALAEDEVRRVGQRHHVARVVVAYAVDLVQALGGDLLELGMPRGRGLRAVTSDDVVRHVHHAQVIDAAVQVEARAAPVREGAGLRH